MGSFCNIYVKTIIAFFLGLLILSSLIGCRIESTTTSSVTSTPEKSLPMSANKEITVFAGSSSKVALDLAGKAFQAKTGIKVYFNFGGSGTLLSQIKLTKTGDLFFPASPDFLAKALADNIIYPETEAIIYYLVPAILVQKGNPQNIRSLSDLSKPGLKLAIADPQSVPAGLFAYEVLDYNKLLTDVAKNVVTYGESNDKISSLVILKSVDAAIGWDIVAKQQPNSLDVVYLQPDQIPRISYMSGAITTFTYDKESAQSFLDFLTSTEGKTIFTQNGYYTAESEVRKFASNAQIGGEYRLPPDYKPLVK